MINWGHQVRECTNKLQISIANHSIYLAENYWLSFTSKLNNTCERNRLIRTKGQLIIHFTPLPTTLTLSGKPDSILGLLSFHPVIPRKNFIIDTVCSFALCIWRVYRVFMCVRCCWGEGGCWNGFVVMTRGQDTGVLLLPLLHTAATLVCACVFKRGRCVFFFFQRVCKRWRRVPAAHLPPRESLDRWTVCLFVSFTVSAFTFCWLSTSTRRAHDQTGTTNGNTQSSCQNVPSRSRIESRARQCLLHRSASLSRSLTYRAF